MSKNKSSKKLMSREEVAALNAELNNLIKTLKAKGRDLYIDNLYLLKLFQRSRKAINQLNRTRRDYS